MANTLAQVLLSGVHAPANSHANTGAHGSRPKTGTQAANAEPATGWVRVTVPDTPKLSVLCELGDDAPFPTQGYGGTNQTPRDGDIDLTPYGGAQTLGMDLQIVIDDSEADRSIQDAIDTLEAMSGRGIKRLPNVAGPLPVIVDSGGIMQHDFAKYPGNRWLIDDIRWDTSEDSAVRNDFRDWTRIEASLTLLLASDDNGIAAQTAAVRARVAQSAASSTQFYLSKSGDTLESVARKRLGDVTRWRELGDLNGIRDPRQKIKPVGRPLRLP